MCSHFSSFQCKFTANLCLLLFKGKLYLNIILLEEIWKIAIIFNWLKVLHCYIWICPLLVYFCPTPRTFKLKTTLQCLLMLFYCSNPPSLYSTKITCKRDSLQSRARIHKVVNSHSCGLMTNHQTTGILLHEEQ